MQYPLPNLDRTVDIQQPTFTRDSGTNEQVASWSNYAADVPAEYLPLSGAERFQARQQLATVTANFRMRWRDDLNRRMRLVFEGANWDIQAFEEDRRFARRQYMIVTATQIVAD